MKNRSVSLRLVTATLIISAIAAIAAVSALGAPSPAIKAFDSVKEFFGMAPTSQTVTTAPSELNAVEPMTPMFFVPTTLVVGDVALVGNNSANPDKISLLLLKAIGSGTIIHFTDNGFTAATTGRTGEGYLTYTAPADQPAGTIITWTNGMSIAGTGWSAAAPTNFAFNGAGDQLFVFQGTASDAAWGPQSGVTLLYGINYATALSATSSASNTVQPSTSILPAAAFLNLPTTTFANGYYSGTGSSATAVTISGTAASMFTDLLTAAKWFGTSSTAATFPTYTVTFATAPTVTTSGATSVGTSTATMNGNVTSDGGATVTARGFYWKTGTGVTTGNGTQVSAGSGTGAFTANLSSLTPSTQYSYIAYATNSIGTTLSSPETTFTTAAAALDTTTTIASTVNPTTFGGSTTFTATTVTTVGSTPVAVGTLTIYNNNACSGTVLATGTPNASGQISVSTAALNAPSQSIIACYTAGTGFNSSTSSVLTQTVNKANQTITVDPTTPSNEYLSSGTSGIFTATSNSTLAVSIASTTTSVCTVTGPTAVRANLVGLGTCTLEFTQGGNGNYNAATPVTRSFQVNASPTTTTVTSSAAGPVTYGTSVTFTATIRYQGSPTAHPATGSFKFVNGADCSAPQLQAASAINASGVVLFTSSTLTVGTYDIRACFIPSSGNDLASDAVVSQEITIADQAPLTVVDPGTVTYGTTPQLATTGGSGTGTVTFDQGGGSPGCTVSSSGILTVVQVGAACSITATKAGDTNYNPVSSAPRSITFAKGTPTINTAPSASNIIFGQTLADSILSGGTATPSGGTFTFTTPSTAPAAGTASHGITYTPSDTTNYNNATGSVSVTVGKATPTVTTAPTASDIVEGQSLASSTLSGGTASVAGAFTFTTPTTVPPVGTNSQPVTFTPTDTTNYNNASTATNVTVTAAPTTYTLTATAGANGSFKFGNVLANGVTTVNPGDSRTYRIVPDFGYQVADVLVDSVSVGKGNSYTFTNVQANHTISATFEAVTNRTLTAGTLNTYYDAVIDVPVSVSDTTGANITAFDFSLNYDETKLEPVISSGTNVTITNGTLGTWSGNVVKAATGIINVSRFSASTPASGAGVLLYIKMRVKAHATTTAALTLNGTYLGSSYGTFAPFNGGAVGANAPVAGVVNINATATTTSVVTSGTPSVYGNSVTFTATVSTGGTPAVSGGTVTFYDGGASCASPGPALGAAVNINGSGVAAISTSALFAGTHTILACYGGTSDFTASGGSVAQVVNLRAITVTATDATKGYDGTTSSSAVPTLTAGTIAAGDSATYSQTYDNRNVGTNKVLTPSAVIVNGSSVDVTANYDITLTNGTGVITARAITITAVTSTKTYDGTTSSTGTPTLTSGTIAAGESAVYSQTFDNRNVGTNKTLTPAAVITDGASVNVTANYAITPVTNTTGEITARAISITAGTDSKAYDGTTSSTGTTSLTSGTLASGDSAVYSQTFDTRNVGTGKTLTPAAVISDGASVNVTANYAITPITNTTGEITARAITITAATSTKTYDGTTASSGTPTLTAGTLAAGDSAVYSQVFDSRNVGSRTLTPSAVISDGASVNVTANYAITPVTASGSITARAISVTAATDSKTYDGTTTSTGTPSLTAGTLAAGDSAVYSQVFDSRNVGSRTLTPSAVISDGASVNVTANYAITPITASGSITARAISITAGTDSKVYDGTTSSTGTTTLTSGTLASGDSAVYSQTFDTKHVGTGKTLTPAAVISDGASVNVTANYAITPVVNTTGEITARAITITAVTSTKTYDGTTASSGTPTLTSGSIAAGETAAYSQTFDTKHVGTGKVLTPSAVITDSGNADVSSNYVVTPVTNTTGEITARAITVTAATSTKGYDGTTTSAATPTLTSGTIAAGETAVYSQTFDNRNVGTSKVLTPAAVITDSGSNNVNANYAITLVTNSTGEITARAITITAGTDTKLYDGTTSSAGTTTLTAGTLAAGETAVYSQTFDTKNVGTNKVLTPSVIIKDGSNVVVTSNYAVTPVTNNTGEITARPITVTAVTDTREYNGTTSSAGTPTLTAGTIAAGDSAVYSQVFANKNVGTSKTIIPSAVITDSGSNNVNANYAINLVNNTTGEITARAITITAVTSTKVYDGTTASTGTPVLGPGTIAAGETAVYSQTFDNRTVGSGKTLTPSAVITDGASVNVTANYAITPVTNATGEITARPITITAAADSREYDRTTNSAGVTTLTSGTLAASESAVYSQTFDTKNVGTNKTLTPSVVIRDASNVVVTTNYAVTPVVNSNGVITAKNLTATITAADKTYDGNDTATITSCPLSGVIMLDTVTCSATNAHFNDASIGNNKQVTADINLDASADSGNYTVTSPAFTTASITSGTVTGTINYYGGTLDPVSGVTVSGAGGILVSGTTNASGNYSITGFGAGSYTMTPSRAMQDCDTQNGVLIDDAAMVSEYVVGLTPLSTTQKLAAKVSGTATSTLSSFDAALIAQKSVGICDSPNIAGRWGFAPGTYVHNPVTTHTDDYTGYLLGDVNGDWSSSAVPNLANPESSSPNAVRASLPVGNAQPGTEVMVPFRIDNLSGRSLNSYQFSVAYDPAVIVPADESANVDGTLSGNLNAVYNTPTPGMLRVGVYGAFPTQGDGVYVNLKFRVIGANGSSSPLTISGFRFNHGTDEVTSVNGRITVGTAAPDATLQGRVLALGGRGVTGARVILTTASGTTRNTFTTRNGFFSFGGLAIGESYTVTVQSRRFVFSPRTVAISNNVTNLDFIAEQ